jgi:hypothetical protein
MADDDKSGAVRARESNGPGSGDKKLGRVAIKRVPVSRAEARRAAAQKNPMNLLVPYLDLFPRLDDAQLSRLSGAAPELVAQLRGQVAEIGSALAPYADLLPRLSDDELVRLTGASIKTIRFWRLCRPKPDERPAEGAHAGARPGVAPRKPVAAASGSTTVDGITGDVFPGFEAGGASAGAGTEELDDIEIGMFLEEDEDLDLEDDDEVL